MERASLFGAPTFRWIGARKRLKTEFTVFLMEIPTGYKGVKDVRMDHGAPIVTPK